MRVKIKTTSTIDMTPTWTVAAQIISMTITSGSEEGRSLAAKEVERMGAHIDAQNATIKRLEKEHKREIELMKMGAACAVDYAMQYGDVQ